MLRGMPAAVAPALACLARDALGRLAFDALARLAPDVLARLAAGSAIGLAVAFAPSPASADWEGSGCIEAVGSSYVPGRIIFRPEADALPGDCREGPLAIGADGGSKRDRYAAALRHLRNLALALVRGEAVAVRGEDCRATAIAPASPEASADGPACRPLRSYVAPQADPGPADRWQCQTRVDEVLRYERGGVLRFRTTTHPAACVTQPFLEWRGATSGDRDDRSVNARASLWLLVLAKLEGGLVVVTGSSCDASHLTLWSRRLPPGDDGRCYPLVPALEGE